jgi:hypothetical protein
MSSDSVVNLCDPCVRTSSPQRATFDARQLSRNMHPYHRVDQTSPDVREGSPSITQESCRLGVTVSRQNTIDQGPVLPDLAVASLMVSGLPTDEEAIAQILGVGQEQLKHVKGGVVEAALDVPAGKWRVWPAEGSGIWIGETDSRLPRMPARAQADGQNLGEFVTALARGGLFLQRVRLLVCGAWTSPLPTREWLRRLDDPEVQGIAGGASDGLDTGFGFELHKSGLLLTESLVQADACFTLVRHLHGRPSD